MADWTSPSASELDLAGATWRKSTFSGHNEDCVEVAHVTGATWRKSTYSGPNGECIEVAHLTGLVAVRDSKNPDGATLTFAPAEWRAFVAGIRSGEFDL